MKSTRRSQIRQRIFRLDDLRRVASVFDEQARLAKRSDHSHRIRYALHFADDTSFESDVPDVLDEDVVAIKRPVKVEFQFCNYKLQRDMSFSITHGDSGYGNGFEVASNGDSWLNDNFTRLDEAVKGAEPQSFWLVRHPVVLANLIALGIGSLVILLLDILFSFIEPPQIDLSQPHRAWLRSLCDFVMAHSTWFYLVGWVWKWFVGWLWGAAALTNWLLSCWPSIDLDFGAEHLKIEKKRRKRVQVIWTLVVVPILLAIVQDIIQKAM